MFSYTLIFLLGGIIAGVLGFLAPSGSDAEMAHTVFGAFVIMFLISLIAERKVKI